MPLKNSLRAFLLATVLPIATVLAAQEGSFTMETILPDNSLARAWDIDYGPDDQLWITERIEGRLIRIDPETGARDQLLTIPGVFSGSSQDGLLGFAFDGAFTEGSPFIYLSYTYQQFGERRQRILRYTFSETDGDGALIEPALLIENLPASNDHNSGRLIFGPDQKLYYTIGDQGNNQNRNYCRTILSQALPTQEEIDVSNWTNYPGKTLRLNLDGSIPADNPLFNGVRSHVYTVGHRNAQGLDFGNNGLLYSSEHGPDTDDEVNIITAGGNYGWPRVVGFQDDQAYDFCNWSSLDNCGDVPYTKQDCPPGATFLAESTFTDPAYEDPLFALFAVTDDYDFNNPACEDSYTCRPNVAPSSIAVYDSDGIPEWKNSLLVTSLKRGRVYRLQLDDTGRAVVGDTTHLFYSGNRYRDITISPDGKTFYLLTDQSGPVTDRSGLNRLNRVRNPGTIMRVVYEERVSTSSTVLATRLRVYPNPARNQLSIELPEGYGMGRAELLSASGQRVLSYPKLLPGLSTHFLGELPAGLYFLRVFQEDGSASRKIIIR